MPTISLFSGIRSWFNAHNPHATPAGGTAVAAPQVDRFIRAMTGKDVWRSGDAIHDLARTRDPACFAAILQHYQSCVLLIEWHPQEFIEMAAAWIHATLFADQFRALCAELEAIFPNIRAASDSLPAAADPARHALLRALQARAASSGHVRAVWETQIWPRLLPRDLVAIAAGASNG